jgi:hypothetical protein
MRCKVSVLLVRSISRRAGQAPPEARSEVATIEESVYDSACMKQLPNRTEKVAVRVRLRRRVRREGLEVGPLLGYECTTSLGHGQYQM